MFEDGKSGTVELRSGRWRWSAIPASEGYLLVFRHVTRPRDEMKTWIDPDGREGLVEAARETLAGADILLLDLHMPEPDGFKILELLRAEEVRDPLPILVLTADTTAASRNRALDVGANDYINKPFDTVEVVLRVRNLLQLRFMHLRLLKTNRLLQDRLLELEPPS